MLVCWLLFNFWTSSDFGCCSLAQEMSLLTAICLISGNGLSLAHCWTFCLSSLCLPKVPMEISSLPCPASLMLSEHPTPSAVCSFSVPCLLFSFVFVFVEWGSVCLGDYAGLSQGQLWEYHMPFICSPVGLHLPSRFGAGIWQCRSPPIAWRMFVWAGGSGCWTFDSSCFFLCQVWLQHLGKIFCLQSLCCPLLTSSHHLGSSYCVS
jgi:hypothetical protein